MPINRELRFLDSFRFLPSSLDKLASNLTSDKLHNLRNCYPEENEFQLLQNKGLYPYDYIDDETKLSSEQIPTKLDFYNKLKDEHISDENYNHFKHVWKVFKCKKFKDYHELYLKVDTLLLADIFENFRNTCMNTYPCPAILVAVIKVGDITVAVIWVGSEVWSFWSRSLRSRSFRSWSFLSVY